MTRKKQKNLTINTHTKKVINRRAKKTKTCLKNKKNIFNPDFFCPAFIEQGKKILSGLNQDESSQTFFSNPFPHVILRNCWVHSEDFLTELHQVLMKLSHTYKNSDLFSFYQSQDLKHCSHPSIKRLRRLLYSEVLHFFKLSKNELFNLELDDSYIDLFSSKYTNKDFLLCHDDRLESRAIAFIFYLVPESWPDQDGGALELFSCSDLYVPENVVKRIVPEKNSVILFAVSKKSFHQVSEVVSDKARISIGGWFHYKHRKSTADDLQNQEHCPIALSYELPIENHHVTLEEWINAPYLNLHHINLLRSHFVESRSIFLKQFLKLDNYARVLSALEFFENLRRKLILESTDRQRLTSFLTSERSGINYLLEIRQSRIANRVRREKFLIRRIEKKSKMSDPIFISEKVEFCVKTILDFQDFLSSRSFLNFVCSITSLDLEKSNFWLNRYTNGDYTLLTDDQHCESKNFLHFIFYSLLKKDKFMPNWEDDWGGSTNYISNAGEHELEVTPAENSLSLVFRNCGIRKFLKYINNSKPPDVPLFQFEKEFLVE